jgi:hypothetical protein
LATFGNFWQLLANNDGLKTDNLRHYAWCHSCFDTSFGSGEKEIRKNDGQALPHVQNFYVSNFRFGVPICFFSISKYEIGTPK